MLVNPNEMAGYWGSEVHTSGLKTATVFRKFAQPTSGIKE